MPGNKHSGNRSGEPRAAGAGRPPTRAIVETGDGLMILHVTTEGTADLGRGRVTISAIGRSRIIHIAQPDGSEIRIAVIKD